MQIEIRPFKKSDPSALQRAILSSVGHVGQWEDWCTPRYTLSDARSWVAESHELWLEQRAFRWVIVDEDSIRKPHSDIFGSVEIKIPVPGKPFGRLGYWVARHAIGQGVCTQAAAQVLHWGFETLGLTEVDMLIQPDNAASIAVAEKLGASFQECLDEGITFRGEAKPANRYVVTPAQLATAGISPPRRPWPLSDDYLCQASS
jgi:RimJ/RimL family protein N-acetyltransferase